MKCKDILVAVNSKATVWDIYEAKEVRESGVRIWPNQVVSDVQNGESKIRCHIWDEKAGRSHFTYDIEELKGVSTESLVRSAPVDERRQVLSPVYLRLVAETTSVVAGAGYL